MWRCSRNFARFAFAVARSPGIMSSSETPITSTPLSWNCSLIACTSPISATHGAHHVAQTLTTRTWDAGRNACSTSDVFRTSARGASSSAARMENISVLLLPRNDPDLLDLPADEGDRRVGLVNVIGEVAPLFDREAVE